MKYNEAQRQAIEHNKGPMMVLAGPGSGKTTVIINRTRTLIEKYGVDPRRILVITFTKAAAEEMKERFLKLMNNTVKQVNFGTFHAIFFSILRYAYKYNYSNIIKNDVKQKFIREIVAKYELETDDEKELLSNIESEISLVKGEMMDLSKYYSTSCPADKFRKIYNEYNERLEQNRLIDFDDMIVKCYRLFKDYPNILKQWQAQYDYILIDEFQDINRMQYDIVRMLAKPQDNLFIVGDDDQSIYRFRGAKPEIMLNFTKDYPNSKVCNLDINYRSTECIVDTGSKIIKNNKKRYKKNIRTTNDRGENVKIVLFDTVKDECERIVKSIRKYVDKGVPYSEIAVLYRTNSQPRGVVEKLMEYNMPFIIRDGLPSIYNHRIAENMISYMTAAKQCFGEKGTRLIDRGTFMKIANKPNRYISRAYMNDKYVDFESLKSYYEDKDWMVDRIEQLEFDLKNIARMNPFSAVNYIRNAVGYDEYLSDYAISHKINVDELFEILNEFQESCKGLDTLDDLFQHIENYNEQLKKNMNKAKETKDAITMTTFHGSKGLEFKVVYIIDANEEITPHKKSVLEADIEEERRMFYVAVTRAKTNLNIYYVKERYGKELQPSRFVGEILVDKEEVKEGAIIKHKVYGQGKILKVDDKKLTVKFSKIEMSKVLDLDYCIGNRLIEVE